jgi:Fe-S-cluster-containing hydrogenase component 2
MMEERRIAEGSTTHKFIDVDPEKCIGCAICELVCSLEKSEKKAVNPSVSRIRVLRLYPTVNIAMACRLCDAAPCVRACPQNALTQSGKNGIIVTNESKCNGCGWCLEACKYGSIVIHPKKKVAQICDLCEGRRGIGVFPGRRIMSQACIEWCPEEALDLVTRNRRAQKAGEKVVADLFGARE